MRKFLGLLCLWFCVSFVTQGITALPRDFSNIYFFGDGLTDQGEYHPKRRRPCFREPAPQVNVTQGAHAGKTWASSFADLLHFQALPASEGGSNWATVGAKAIDVLTQTRMYLASVGEQPDPNALYIIWGGGEDFFQKIIEQKMSAAQVIIDGVEEINESVQLLARHGARHILVIGLYDISLIPFIQMLSSDEQDAVKTFCTKWNQLLFHALPYLQNHFSRLKLYTWDPMPLMQSVHHNPALFGFPENVTGFLKQVVKNDMVWWCGLNQASSPDDYLFFNPINPSTAFHHLIAKTILTEAK